MRPFAIRIALASEAIIGRRYHLDALLAALVIERSGDLVAAHDALPLARRDGVWQASAALLEGPCTILHQSICQSLRRETDLAVHRIAPNGNRYPGIDTKRGSYQNTIDVAVAYEASAVWFCGVGDVDAVRAMIEDVPAIGRKRNAGRGRVAGIDVEEIGRSQAGWCFGDGTPARSIPRDKWDGVEPAEMAMETWRAPYWNGAFALCVVPRHLIVSRDDAMTLCGVT